MDHVSLLFEAPGATARRTVRIGACRHGSADCSIYIDEMFFFKDPHLLYAHWSPDIWAAIGRQEAAVGIDLLRLGFWPGAARRYGEPPAGGIPPTG